MNIVVIIIVLILLLGSIALVYYTYISINSTLDDMKAVLSTKGQCTAMDEKEQNLFSYIDDYDEDGKPIIKNGTLDDKLCIFNPLFLTDKKFRESALMLYSPSQMLNAIQHINDGSWSLPSTDLVSKDPVLANMILNPWYISDDAYNVHQTITYNSTLNSFTVNGKEYRNFTDSGLNLSSYSDNKSIAHWYLFMDNQVVINLPIQLYLQKLPPDQRKGIKVKISGKITEPNVEPINVTTLEELNSVLNTYFYLFKDTKKGFKDCINKNPDGQKAMDGTCKFFNSDGLAGIIITLKRILVVNLSPDVIADYINYMDIKLENDNIVDYLDFFLWLAMKSHRDKVTYDFVLRKNS